MADDANTLELNVTYNVTFDQPILLRLGAEPPTEMVTSAQVSFYQTTNGFTYYRAPGTFFGFMADAMLEHMVSATPVHVSKLGQEGK